jgi:hypothetical protein
VIVTVQEERFQGYGLRILLYVILLHVVRFEKVEQLLQQRVCGIHLDEREIEIFQLFPPNDSRLLCADHDVKVYQAMILAYFQIRAVNRFTARLAKMVYTVQTFNDRKGCLALGADYLEATGKLVGYECT